MVAKPPLPDRVDLPSEVNGWVHDPDSNRNGHVWTARDADRSVAVFSHFGTTISVAVFDDRVDRFANRIEPVRRDIREEESQSEAVAWGVKRAVGWMQRHAPTEWGSFGRRGSRVRPAGRVRPRPLLSRGARAYRLLPPRECRTRRRDGWWPCPRLDGEPGDAGVSRRQSVARERQCDGRTRPLAPGPQREMSEVVDPPAECGIAIAVKLAREYVREKTGRT